MYASLTFRSQKITFSTSNPNSHMPVMLGLNMQSSSRTLPLLSILDRIPFHILDMKNFFLSHEYLQCVAPDHIFWWTFLHILCTLLSRFILNRIPCHILHMKNSFLSHEYQRRVSPDHNSWWAFLHSFCTLFSGPWYLFHP